MPPRWGEADFMAQDMTFRSFVRTESKSDVDLQTGGFPRAGRYHIVVASTLSSATWPSNR
jgi:hypothetical protein